MKTLQLILLILFLTPAISFGQSSGKKSGSSKSQKVYHRKTTRTKISTDTSDVNAILKDSANAESGPILNDNGNISTTGTIDGRSSTGRPGTDTTTSYTVKRSKKTIRTGGAIMPDTIKKKAVKP
ncbi:hypothetical protein [Dyadobacter pollutisoli]|uniref:Uncharacterized protein n=1 Tax=Dyadobacter pollutisoli TaxID=2910158 RepID=A0A9E8NEP4_9BACT|nr:hypothetical protein [Dyadobacter pollutisoli]WAC13596.1 hypothetical protein ON006_06485 [Dyadobacter pollutisoli]